MPKKLHWDIKKQPLEQKKTSPINEKGILSFYEDWPMNSQKGILGSYEDWLVIK